MANLLKPIPSKVRIQTEYKAKIMGQILLIYVAIYNAKIRLGPFELMVLMEGFICQIPIDSMCLLL